jgi:hypothetical protein
VKGGKTRAILKVLGRGAIVLATAAWNLAWWMFWAAVNLLWLFAAIKRAAERVALRMIGRRKARRLASHKRALAALFSPASA